MDIKDDCVFLWLVENMLNEQFYLIVNLKHVLWQPSPCFNSTLLWIRDNIRTSFKELPMECFPPREGYFCNRLCQAVRTKGLDLEPAWIEVIAL